MKKMIGIMSILLTGVFLLSIPAHAIPSVSLTVMGGPIYVGDAFSVTVHVDGVTDSDSFGPDELLSFGFDLNVNPLEFIYTSTDVELPFSDDSMNFAATDVAGSSFPGSMGNGILLATMNFAALLAGDFNIGIVSDILDPNEGLGTLIYDGLFSLPKIDMTSTADITVKAAPVPEPTTLLLLGTGLIGLVSYRRVKK